MGSKCGRKSAGRSAWLNLPGVQGKPTVSNGKGILQPIVQYGFAGTTAVLLGIVVWQVKCSEDRFDKVLEMQKATNQVIERNTAAIANLAEVVHHP